MVFNWLGVEYPSGQRNVYEEISMRKLNASGRVVTVLLLFGFSLNAWAANVMLGTSAMGNDNGSNNVAVGDYTLLSNTSGSYNTASGTCSTTS